MNNTTKNVIIAILILAAAITFAWFYPDIINYITGK